MNLFHLKALCEIVEQGLHLSNAAQSLHRSQPALTRQIQQLESELGITLFERKRNRLVGLTERGARVADIARRMVNDAADISRLAEDFDNDGCGELTIATTHTQARYTLPPAIREFMKKRPGVTLVLKQGSAVQCCDMVARGQADIAICSETGERADVVQIPCYFLQRIVVTPPRHPLLRAGPLTLQEISRHPIITYAEGFSGRSIVDSTFRDAGLAPKVILSAIDADVSKAYVEMGLGIAILASVSFETRRDKGLRQIDARHLFEPSRLNVMIRANSYVRAFTTDFIRTFAPALSLADVRRAMEGSGAPRRELPSV
jgi:LysR family cys regulon transcriptional activator